MPNAGTAFGESVKYITDFIRAIGDDPEFAEMEPVIENWIENIREATRVDTATTEAAFNNIRVIWGMADSINAHCTCERRTVQELLNHRFASKIATACAFGIHKFAIDMCRCN